MSETQTQRTTGTWQRGVGTWDGDEFWTVETEDGTVVCQEPTTFHCYESGGFITAEGEEANVEFIVNACNAHDDLLAACAAGGRYSNALKKYQEAGTVGAVDATDELDRLFEDWHDKTHAATAKAKERQ